MKTWIAVLLGVLCICGTARAQLCIEECVAKAEANYPLVKKYKLLDATSDIDLSEINKTWLPRLGVYGQATAQNVVPSFPQALTGVLSQLGQTVRGLDKIQYKVGVDVSQTVWDGGASKARREAVRAQDDVRRSSLDVELYALRQRVESVYFAILLTEEQIDRSRESHKLLLSNLDRMRAMFKNGVALQSDVDMVQAQALEVAQGIEQAVSAADGYRRVLELFIGEELGGMSLQRPVAEQPSAKESCRPELKLFDSRRQANAASNHLSDVALMPKIGLFAQAYYGYPGFDYFKSMMSRDLSFNILAGVKVSWNIDAFYSRKNNTTRTSVNMHDIEADRETFMFNNDIQAASQREAIAGLRKVMKDDNAIIALRENVRKAAESQLENGIIDATSLLSKISDENIARLNAGLHEIQLLKEIYNLKYTLNR